LLGREDLSAVLIESKEKKARFLAHAAHTLGLSGRVEIVNRQFEELDPGKCEFVACRALDRFTEKLPRLLKWAKRRRVLLFGGPNLAVALEKLQIKFEQKLLPTSDQRFLFDLPGPS